MPVKDPDGGLNFQGYDPRTLTGKIPVDQTATKPFRFGGSNVPINLGIDKSESRKVESRKVNCSLSLVHKYPFIRK